MLSFMYCMYLQLLRLNILRKLRQDMELSVLFPDSTLLMCKNLDEHGKFEILLRLFRVQNITRIDTDQHFCEAMKYI